MKLLNQIILCLLITSCATQRFELTEGKKRSVPSFEGKNHFIFWGLGQEKTIDPMDACNEGETVEAINTHETFVDGLLTLITWGIYYPRSYAVYCSKKV